MLGRAEEFDSNRICGWYTPCECHSLDRKGGIKEIPYAEIRFLPYSRLRDFVALHVPYSLDIVDDYLHSMRAFLELDRGGGSTT